MSCLLFTVFVFVCALWCPTHIVFFVRLLFSFSFFLFFLRLVYSMLPVSLDCPFLALRYSVTFTSTMNCLYGFIPCVFNL